MYGPPARSAQEVDRMRSGLCAFINSETYVVSLVGAVRQPAPNNCWKKRCSSGATRADERSDEVEVEATRAACACVMSLSGCRCRHRDVDVDAQTGTEAAWKRRASARD